MPKAKLTTRERTTSNVSSDNLNKGSELSFAEADSNFINLRDRSWGLADDTSTVLQVTDDKTITIAGGTGVTTSLSGDTLTITSSVVASGGNLADLQVNGTELSPVTTNADLTLTANGTGEVVVEQLHLQALTATVSSANASVMRLKFEHPALYNRNILTIDAGDQSGSNGSQMRFYTRGINYGAGGFYFYSMQKTPFVGTNADADYKDFTLGCDGTGVIHLRRTTTGGGVNHDVELQPDGTYGRVIIKDNKLVIEDTRTVTGIGEVGDQRGAISYDGTNLYVCTGAYDGSTVIWKKLVLQTI